MRSKNRSRLLVLAGLTVAVALVATGQAMAQATASKKFAGTKAGDRWNGNRLKMKFCWCPAGKFKMGSPKNEKGQFFNEDQVSVA